jgi:transcriptional regulator with XRE-family HTH domain
MDGLRLGRQFRAIRLRQNLRQLDVGKLARLSRPVISRIDRGLVGNIRIDELDRAARALGARLDIRLRWNGEELDRLLDEGHARLVDLVVVLLRVSGWEVAVEVSYSIWGERGSIDILAYHLATGIVLVVEVKSVVPDSQATLHALDRKTRLATQIARERGWDCRSVARLLVIGDSATSRRRIARVAATYSSTFPVRGPEVGRWIRRPDRPIAGLVFLAFAPGGRSSAPPGSRHRVRRRRRGPMAAKAGIIAPRGSV